MQEEQELYRVQDYEPYAGASLYADSYGRHFFEMSIASYIERKTTQTENGGVAA